MRILAAPDSFKESLTAVDVCATLRDVLGAQGHVVESIPLADGGEGTVDAVLAALPGERVSLSVRGPLGDSVEACYALLDGGETAVVEMAQASGLHLLAPADRRPLDASTYGTGQLIRDALNRGARRIIVGLGGSATTDGGAGAAQALGARLLDAATGAVPPGGRGLLKLNGMELDEAQSVLSGVEILAACDVDNPFLGPKGAARIYGPQKGASRDEVDVLERGLEKLCAVIARDTGMDVSEMPGAGAAGGLAGGLVALCGARIVSGFQYIADAVGLEERVAASDVVVTGEGQIDAQTFQGKTVSGVCAAAKRHGVPVYVIAGRVAIDAQGLAERGIVGAVSLQDLAGPEGNPLESPVPYLRDAARHLADSYFQR